MDVFRSMQIFVEVAREKSFRGAADNLGVPNSTVSRRIAELERDVGLRLFDRSTRRVTLTDAGKKVREEAEAKTNELFFAPWQSLTHLERVELLDLLQQLEKDLAKEQA